MGRKTIDGFAVVKPGLTRRSFEVMGVGQDRWVAWKDAAELHSNGRLDAKEMIARHPGWKCVPAKVTVTFENPEVV